MYDIQCDLFALVQNVLWLVTQFWDIVPPIPNPTHSSSASPNIFVCYALRSILILNEKKQLEWASRISTNQRETHGPIFYFEGRFLSVAGVDEVENLVMRCLVPNACVCASVLVCKGCCRSWTVVPVLPSAFLMCVRACVCVCECVCVCRGWCRQPRTLVLLLPSSSAATPEHEVCGKSQPPPWALQSASPFTAISKLAHSPAHTVKDVEK